MKRVSPLFRTVRRAMSCLPSQSESPINPPPKTGDPHGNPAPSRPATMTARIAANARFAIGEGGRKRESSRRSPAIVRIGKASHHVTTSCTVAPPAHSTLPVDQHSAPSVSVNVNSAVCRRKTSIVAASSTRLAATMNHDAIDGAPASAKMVPRLAHNGPA